MSLLTSFAISLLFGSSLQKSRLCDRSDKSFVIDSAVAFNYLSKIKVRLFYGDKVSESDAMDSNDMNGSKFSVHLIKDIDPDLIAPIDIAYDDSHFIILQNIVNKTYWQIDQNSLSVVTDKFDIPQSIDCFHLSSTLLCLKNSTSIGFNLYDSWKGSAQCFATRTVANQRQIKLTEDFASQKCFDGKLNGIAITAAMNRIISGKEYIYMFAGRNLCRQEIRTDWVAMCDIQDIADWIDCTKDEVSSTSDRPLGTTTNPPKPTNKRLNTSKNRRNTTKRQIATSKSPEKSVKFVIVVIVFVFSLLFSL